MVKLNQPVVVLTPPNGAGMADTEITPAAEGITGVVETTTNYVVDGTPAGDIKNSSEDFWINGLISTTPSGGGNRATKIDPQKSFTISNITGVIFVSQLWIIGISMHKPGHDIELTFADGTTVNRTQLEYIESASVPVTDKKGTSTIEPAYKYNGSGELKSIKFTSGTQFSMGLDGFSIDGTNTMLESSYIVSTASLTYTTDKSLELLTEGQSMSQVPGSAKGQYVSHTNTTLELTNVTGTWAESGDAVSDTEYTELGPSATDVKFTSANGTPLTAPFSGSNTTFASRIWSLASSADGNTYSAFTDYTDTSVASTQTGATEWQPPAGTLADNTFYKAKVTYNSETGVDPVTSAEITFKTASGASPDAVMSGLRFDSARSTKLNRTGSGTGTISYWKKDSSTAWLWQHEHQTGAAYPAEIGAGYDGYMSDYYFVDGQNLPAETFIDDFDGLPGPLDSSVVKTNIGDFGPNGFYLPFDPSDIGGDASGKGNNFTPSKFNALDSVVDTPVKNYAVLQSGTNGNLSYAGTPTDNPTQISKSGNFYAEMTYTGGASVSTFVSLGGCESVYQNPPYLDGVFALVYGNRISFRVNEKNEGDSYSEASVNGDLIGIAMKDNGEAKIYKNGIEIFSANATPISNFIWMARGNGPTATYNFGQQPFAASNVTHDLNAGTVVIDGVTYGTLYKELEGYQVAGGYFYDEKNQEPVRGSDLRKRFGITSADPQLGIYDLTEVPSHQVIGYEKVGSKYQALRDYTPEVRVAQAETTAVTAELTEAQATITAQRQMIIRAACTWVVGKAYEEGDIILFNGHVFKALTATTATADNDPGDETGDWEFLGLEEDTAPTVIDGYYPLYTTEAASNAAGNGSSHTHTFDGVTYYMPNGGTTIYHGTYTGYSY